jgi:hypothetical protein
LALKASSAQESCLLTSGNCDHDLSWFAELHFAIRVSVCLSV